MRLPDKFPKDCVFVPTAGGDWFVEMPGKGWFKLSEDGDSLDPRPLMAAGREGAPRGGLTFSTDPTGLLAAAKAAS